MTQHHSSRTLVKSPPELWAECSDAASLARHLGAFGEIRITKLEPETAVAWEGAAASGTVRLEPSGWGTRVTMTLQGLDGQAEVEDPVAPAAAAAEPPPEPDADAQSDADAQPEPDADAPAQLALAPPPRGGILSRLLGALWRRPGRDTGAQPPPQGPGEADLRTTAHGHADGEAASPDAIFEPDGPPGPDTPPPAGGEAALAAALDSLGRAHHRPFSRA